MSAKSNAEIMTAALLVDGHEACRLLAISARTLFEIEQPRGPLPVIRVGTRMKRYDPRDLLAYIDAQKAAQAVSALQK